MKFLFLILSAGLLASTMATAQETTQVITSASGGSVTTTVASPAGTNTTRVVTTGGQSMVGKLRNGSKIEMDSDNSVYIVYPDGARVAAPNGVNTLIDGRTITVKDGKRMP